MKKIVMIYFIKLYAACFSSCRLFSELMGLTTTTTNTPLPSSDGRTKLRPTLLFSAPSEAKQAKILTSNAMTGAEYNVALGCPALSGFIDGVAALDEGNDFQTTFLGDTKHFFFEESIFLQDSNGQVFSSANTKSAVYYTMKGKVSDDGDAAPTKKADAEARLPSPV